jgi:hypothetical protein
MDLKKYADWLITRKKEFECSIFVGELEARRCVEAGNLKEAKKIFDQEVRGLYQNLLSVYSKVSWVQKRVLKRLSLIYDKNEPQENVLLRETERCTGAIEDKIHHWDNYVQEQLNEYRAELLQEQPH